MPPREKPSATDRFLRLFSDVRAGESGTVLLLGLNVFLILTAYYFIKPVREALILESGGAEIKAYSSAGQALLLVGIVPIYGALAGRLPRKKLINVVTAFFAACMVAFYLIGQAAGSSLSLALVFFLWIGIFNVMVIAQFWSFANDIYTSEEGERLFPIVAFGASAGAVVGSWLSGGVISVFGVFLPLIVAAGVLTLSLVVTNWVDARERRRKEVAGVPSVLDTATMPAASTQLSLADIRKAIEEYDKLQVEREARGETDGADGEDGTAGRPASGGPASDLTQTWQFAGTGEGPFKLVFKAAAGAAGGLTEGEFIGAFYSRFFAVVNGLGLLIQLFLVSRVIKYLGARTALIILPLIALGGYALLAFYPILSIVRWTKTAENATDYSLQNTMRNVVFLPCTREQKYKAKQAIDSFFWRAGDVLAAAVVFLGTTYLAMGASQFAMVNIGLVLIWLALAALIGREYVKLVASGRPPCVESPFGSISV
ncbi:MAG: hypothetical protein P8Y11_09200 [Gemmatimonadales bacterium]